MLASRMGRDTFGGFLRLLASLGVAVIGLTVLGRV